MRETATGGVSGMAMATLTVAASALEGAAARVARGIAEKGIVGTTIAIAASGSAEAAARATVPFANAQATLVLPDRFQQPFLQPPPPTRPPPTHLCRSPPQSRLLRRPRLWRHSTE